jgi:dTDP-D-glucose 4,6-dehydratase
LCVPMAKTYDLPFMLTNCSNNYGWRARKTHKDIRQLS